MYSDDKDEFDIIRYDPADFTVECWLVFIANWFDVFSLCSVSSLILKKAHLAHLSRNPITLSWTYPWLSMGLWVAIPS